MNIHTQINRTRWRGAVLGIVLAALAMAAGAQTDFSELSDLDLMFHEDREAATAELKLRTKDYTPRQIRELEEEYFRRVRDPEAWPEPSVEDVFAKINQTDDTVRRLKQFMKIQKRFEEADDTEKRKIRDRYLSAWSDVPYPPHYDDTKIDNVMRYRDYANNAGLYFTKEDELLPLLEERCLNIEAWDRHGLFVDSLLSAKIELGELSARRVESLYNEITEANTTGIGNDVEYVTLGQIHQILGRCGKPGFDALLRLGTGFTEHGIFSLRINTSPEAEALLWEFLANTSDEKRSIQLDLLRALYAKRGTPAEQITRRDKLRREFSKHLAVPEGVVDIWITRSAVELAKDTKDSYYLPQVRALEKALFQLGPESYRCPGMEDRMDEALASLRDSFDETIASLEHQAAGEN